MIYALLAIQALTLVVMAVLIRLVRVALPAPRVQPVDYAKLAVDEKPNLQDNSVKLEALERIDSSLQSLDRRLADLKESLTLILHDVDAAAASDVRMAVLEREVREIGSAIHHLDAHWADAPWSSKRRSENDSDGLEAAVKAALDNVNKTGPAHAAIQQLAEAAERALALETDIAGAEALDEADFYALERLDRDGFRPLRAGVALAELSEEEAQAVVDLELQVERFRRRLQKTLLERFNLRKLEIQPGVTRFQAEYHQADDSGWLKSDSPERDRIIYEVEAAGFQCSGRVIRKALVKYYRYEPDCAGDARKHEAAPAPAMAATAQVNVYDAGKGLSQLARAPRQPVAEDNDRGIER
ncbi:MAG TPA: hypothetical protein VGS41_09900 [Chthonomonadales bacterium]|nr:hypothetical protein [Chthonomonadales bacterium]